MITKTRKQELITSLLSMFQLAKADADREAAFVPAPEIDCTLTEAEPDDLLRLKSELPATEDEPRLAVIPQACALLLSNGCDTRIIGGVATNPMTTANIDAENAVKIAHGHLKTTPGLTKGFQIVAIALTAIKGQSSGEENILDLFEESLSQLPKSDTTSMLLVDPVTHRTTDLKLDLAT